MTTDIKNLQILKAMYAAADAIIEANYVLLKEPLTAAQIVKEIGNDKLVTDGLSTYDQSNWLKAGSYEGFTLTDEGLTVNITVGSFSCTMYYGSLFGMIAKFEKLCGVSASKAKKFANKQDSKQMVYAVKVTKELKTLPVCAGKDKVLRPVLTCIHFDLVNNVAVATDGRIMRVAPVISELAEDISDLQIKDGYNVPANVVKGAKVGDVLSIDENNVIYLNGNALAEDLLIDWKFPNWLSVFRIATHTNIANVAKVSKDIKKAATTAKKFCAGRSDGTRPFCLSFDGLKWSLIGLDEDEQTTQTKDVTLADVKDNNYMSRMSGSMGLDINNFLLLVADVKYIYLPSNASGYITAKSSTGVITMVSPFLLEHRDTTFYNAGKDTETDFFTDFGFTRIEPVTDGSLLNNASNVASFAAVTDNIAFADNAPASVEEHTDTNDTNDTDKIYLPVVSAVSVPAVIAPAKEEKAEEHTDTMQPVIISLPVATVQPVEALDAECVELVDDDTNDTDTDTTANDQEHTDHLLRRIFAIAASYIAIVVMMVLAFGGNDNINANNIHTTAKESTQRVYFAAADTLTTDTTETTTQRVYKGAPAVADTLVADKLEPYSAKCYQLTGDTYDIREQLREYGVWNRARQCWFISNKKAAKLADFLGIALA